MAIFCTERNEYVPYLTCMDCGECEKNGSKACRHPSRKKVILDELADLAGKLKISEENHTKEELESPKYAKAYKQLKDGISELIVTLLQETFFEVIYEVKDLTEEELATAQQITEETVKYASRIIFLHKDVALYEMVLDHSAKLFQEHMGKIWVKRQQQAGCPH